MARRDRERRAARQAAFLEPRRRLLVVCEGAVTELQYFEAFQRWCRNPRVEVRTHGPAGVPFPLVSVAKELKQEAERKAKTQGDENLRYDEVWCVFDVDEHPRVSEARQMATDNGLKLAMSDPCFEGMVGERSGELISSGLRRARPPAGRRRVGDGGRGAR